MTAPSYRITFAKSASRELRKLSPDLATRIFPRIEVLGTAPRPAGCQKRKGNNALWRICAGAYRILYEIDDDRRTLDIVPIGDRKEIYR